MSELPELWNINRLAEYLGAPKAFVYRLTREHRIRFLKVGKELRFWPEDVTAYLEAESVPATVSASVSAAEPARLRRGRPRNRDRVAS
jgi:excisionase family DNA binding protein